MNSLPRWSCTIHPFITSTLSNVSWQGQSRFRTKSWSRLHHLAMAMEASMEFFLTSILSFRFILVTHHTWFPATSGERRSSGSVPRHSATPHWEIHVERSRQRAITHGCRSFDGSPPTHRHTQLCHHSSAIWANQRGHGGATQFGDPDGRRCWGFAYSRISVGHSLVTGGSQWWWWRSTRCRGGCGHRFCQCARYKTLTLSSAPLSLHQEVCD